MQVVGIAWKQLELQISKKCLLLHLIFTKIKLGAISEAPLCAVWRVAGAHASTTGMAGGWAISLGLTIVG